eukprot:3408512-Amphidinium_carterae.1
MRRRIKLSGFQLCATHCTLGLIRSADKQSRQETKCCQLKTVQVANVDKSSTLPKSNESLQFASRAIKVQSQLFRTR